MIVTIYDNSLYPVQRLLRLVWAEDLDMRSPLFKGSGLTLFLIILDLHVGERFQNFA